MKITERGAWLEKGGHTYDASLAEAIVSFLKWHDVQSVIDIGCGDGSYTNRLIESGIDCIGYDGNPNSKNIADFSELQNLGFYDCVLSLEVGEHIPREYEDNFIANLTNHARRWIVLSWAVPGQGGVGHVNERDNDYIRGKLLNRGFLEAILTTQKLRDSASNCYWFKNTLMVFRRE